MIPLPMSPEVCLTQVIVPALSLFPKYMDSPEARVVLVAIALQETGLRSRWQILNDGGKGPARGLWQFERGGVAGVHRHHSTHEHLRLLCRDVDCNFEPSAILAMLEHNDQLAAGVARLLLYSDAYPLPRVDDADGAWNLYAERTWRPGKPHAHTWKANHAKACEVVL
jgi:hypothetical protein